MGRKPALGGLALAAAGAFTGTGLAGLAGVVPGFPAIVYDTQGALSYDAGTGLFSVEAAPLAIRFAPIAPPRFVDPTGDPPGKSLSIRFVLDQLGNLVGGDGGPDLLIVGQVDEDGDNLPDADGVLLSGEVLAFGFSNTPGTPTDEYDLLFAVTGGSLAPLYVDSNIGITITSESSSFDGDFAVSFQGEAKGVVGPVQVCRFDLVCSAEPVDKDRDNCDDDDDDDGGKGRHGDGKKDDKKDDKKDGKKDGKGDRKDDGRHGDDDDDDDDDGHGGRGRNLITVGFEATDVCGPLTFDALIDIGCEVVAIENGQVVDLKCGRPHDGGKHGRKGRGDGDDDDDDDGGGKGDRKGDKHDDDDDDDDDDGGGGARCSSELDGDVLRIRSDIAILVVTATDGAGNSETCEIDLCEAFGGGDDDRDDDDDDDRGDDDDDD